MMFMDKSEYFIPTNDYVFKRIFGHVGNESITKELLNRILDTKVESIDLSQNTILERDLVDDKMGILDIKAKINEKIMCDIEMQVAGQEDIEKRLVYYWGKLYTKGIKKSEDYSELKKCIAIMFSVTDLKNLKFMPKGHTEWGLREKDFGKILLTDVCEIHIIEMKKMMRLMENKDFQEEKLLNWVKFLLDPNKLGGLEMKDKAIKKAKEEFDEIQKDEYERRMAELRMKHIRDSKAIEKYGYNNGFEDGVKQGIEQEKEKLVKEVIRNGADIEFIVKCTKMSEEEIEKLK